MLKAESLKDFYETETGKLVCQILRNKIFKTWGAHSDEKIMGYGFALPYLPLFADYNSCVAFCPAAIGGLKIEGLDTVIVDENNLPARNDVYDKIICIHGAELSNKLPNLISEFWRILSPNGKLILITANQDSFWRKSKTPFAGGMSYTKYQLMQVLMHNKFFLQSANRALFFPQFQVKLLGKIFETLGSVLWNRNGGVNIVTAQKMIFSPRGRRIRAISPFLEKFFKPKAVTARDKS
jgi:SAM-dependent methyltransferase